MSNLLQSRESMSPEASFDVKPDFLLQISPEVETLLEEWGVRSEKNGMELSYNNPKTDKKFYIVNPDKDYGSVYGTPISAKITKISEREIAVKIFFKNDLEISSGYRLTANGISNVEYGD